MKELLVRLALRWHRPAEAARLHHAVGELSKIASDVYAASNISTTTQVSRWATSICQIWGRRGLDGCHKLILQYDMSCRMSAAGHLHTKMLSKLGSVAARNPSSGDNDLACIDATELTLAEIIANNDRAFLEALDDLIARWDAENPLIEPGS